MIKFFDKKVKNIELLFRASSFKFELEDYMQLCGPVTDTFFLVES